MNVHNMHRIAKRQNDFVRGPAKHHRNRGRAIKRAPFGGAKEHMGEGRKGKAS